MSFKRTASFFLHARTHSLTHSLTHSNNLQPPTHSFVRCCCAMSSSSAKGASEWPRERVRLPPPRFAAPRQRNARSLIIVSMRVRGGRMHVKRAPEVCVCAFVCMPRHSFYFSMSRHIASNVALPSQQHVFVLGGLPHATATIKLVKRRNCL